MPKLFRSSPAEYRSTNYETKRNLIESRDNQRRRARRLRNKMDILQSQNEQLRQQLAISNEQLHQERQRAELQRSIAEQDSNAAANLLLSERPIFGHHFGARMIALCINLAHQVGFRPARRVLQTIFDAFQIRLKIPSHDSIRQWASRLGVGELQDTFSKDQDVLWMADHSSQIGQEKVLLIIGIAVKDLPEPGQTLCLDDVKVLAIVPGQKWKKEDVGREYKKLAAQIGAPDYLLCDGAIELREPAEKLDKGGRKTIVLGDLKHHAANVLEKQIGRSERFKAFLSQVGLTRNRAQQTELSHFAPPPLKPKSRFMNLGQLLKWAGMVLHHLGNPQSESRIGITAERMNEKLGWLEEYRDDLQLWSACQDLIDAALSFINHEGLSRGTGVLLHKHLRPSMETSWRSNKTFRRLAASLIRFVRRSEQKLEKGQRAWLSTEILESLFGRFKRLEGQHSKGGFTSLLAALPTLCSKVDGPRVRQRLQEVNNKQLKTWVAKALGPTLTSRRAAAYNEFKLATHG